MKNQKNKNNNLADAKAENRADRSNMPDNAVPRFRSNENTSQNIVKSDAGYLSREVGEGDYGSEEARDDAEKGNAGQASNMPNSKPKDDAQE